MNNNYDAKLWKVLEEGKLTDLSQFHQKGFFDEVPLYSRESAVDFLPSNSAGNRILMEFALKFLKSVIAFEQHRGGYFSAITLWDFSDARFVPNLFVWCRAVRGLKEKLPLKQVKKPFSKRIMKLVSNLRLGDKFNVLEDSMTDPDTTRVFISLMVKPYEGFVTLDQLCPELSLIETGK